MNDILFLNTPTIHLRYASNFAFEKIADLLQAKGMNPEVAIIRAQQVFAHEGEKASLYLQNLQRSFGTDVMQKVYDYIARKALFQEQFSFSSYDQMLRMMQQVYSTSLNEEELKQLRHVSKANSYGISLVR